MHEEADPLRRASDPAPEPQVGIFWGIPGPRDAIVLVTASVALASAEAYGDCLGFPQGHLEVWTAWQRLGAAALARQGLPAAIAFHEYEHFPRGRIVFMEADSTFTIYADRKLQTPSLLAEIVRRFGLADERIDLRSDAHYRSRAM